MGSYSVMACTQMVCCMPFVRGEKHTQHTLAHDNLAVKILRLMLLSIREQKTPSLSSEACPTLSMWPYADCKLKAAVVWLQVIALRRAMIPHAIPLLCAVVTLQRKGQRPFP